MADKLSGPLYALRLKQANKIIAITAGMKAFKRSKANVDNQ